MSARPLAILRNVAAFFAGAALAAAALFQTAPFPEVGTLWHKHQYYVEHGNTYSLLYIGSSRVNHEFIPELFDATLAARGHAVKSFNFGQDGMWPPESFYVTRELLKHPPKNLRWVFLDLMNIRSFNPGNESSLRSVYWHDWRHTLLFLRHVLTVSEEGQRTWSEKAGLVGQHFTMWLQRSLNAGIGSDYLRLALNLERPKKIDPGVMEYGGWQPLANGPLRGEALAQFQRDTARLLAGVDPRPISPVFREALTDLAAEIRAAGAEPIFVVAGNRQGLERFSDWPPPGQTVFHFDDPVKYPALYDPGHHFDLDHLDPQGAADFTRLLAARFAQSLEEKK